MVCFVILHYFALKETIACVNSVLQNVEDTEKKIVIVDNGSTNDSGERLRKYYEHEKSVDVIISTRNNGFARGNNIGYRHCKKNYSPEFIVVMNNDMLIEQKDFVQRIKKVYYETGFYVMGPDVYSLAGKYHQSPPALRCKTGKEIAKKEKIWDFQRRHAILAMTRINLMMFLKKIFCRGRIKKNLYFAERHYDVPIHGSCVIYSKKYVDSKQIAFNNGTFMYMESDILCYECIRDNMLIIYDPSVQIIHLEDVSTDMILKTEKEKMIFKWGELVKSAQVYQNIISPLQRNPKKKSEKSKLVIVEFNGLPGAGKTTVVNMLKQHYWEQGIKTVSIMEMYSKVKQDIKHLRVNPMRLLQGFGTMLMYMFMVFCAKTDIKESWKRFSSIAGISVVYQLYKPEDNTIALMDEGIYQGMFALFSSEEGLLSELVERTFLSIMKKTPLDLVVRCEMNEQEAIRRIRYRQVTDGRKLDAITDDQKLIIILKKYKALCKKVSLFNPKYEIMLNMEKPPQENSKIVEAAISKVIR